MNEKISTLKQWIAESRNLCVFTGAGISCPSGIPDFRSDTGLYSEMQGNIPPEEIISHSFFVKHPEMFYEFYKEKMVYPDAQPNAAHLYFAKLEEGGKRVAVVTQNIDGLHQAAGSREVYELHGSIHRNDCQKCGTRYPLATVTESEDTIPRCPKCGGMLKPDVVLYEEPLDNAVVNGAVNAIAESDLMIVIGTSLSVYPAAAFLQYYRGDKLVFINKTVTPKDDTADLVFHCNVTEVIGELEVM